MRRALARGEHWDERVRVAQWWADMLDTFRSEGSGVAHADTDWVRNNLNFASISA